MPYVLFAIAYVAVSLVPNWRWFWIAAGIVGIALLVIAAILALSGKKQLNATSLKPDRTIDSLKEDQQWAKQQMSSVKQ